MSSETKIHIQNAIKSRMRPQKITTVRAREQINLAPKLDTLFGVLQADGSISKENLADIVDVKAKDIGPIVQRFKKYLKDKHNNEWHLESKAKAGTRIYRLISLTQ